MKKSLVIFLAITALSTSSFAFDGFKCYKKGSDAVLTADIIDEDTAGVSEVEGNIGWAVTAQYQRFVKEGKPYKAVTNFLLDNGGAFDVIEIGSKKIGLLRFSLEDYPDLYKCEEL